MKFAKERRAAGVPGAQVRLNDAERNGGETDVFIGVTWLLRMAALDITRG
jgi:hypothetical protein